MVYYICEYKIQFKFSEVKLYRMIIFQFTKITIKLQFYIVAEINCPVEFVLGEVSETCGVNVGDTCDNFTCIYGYREEKAVTPFECTESGSWSYNVSSLCTGE